MREELIKLRKQNHLTQFQLAQILGISEVYVRKLEKGTRNPSISLMLKIEVVFGVSMKEIFPDIFLLTNDTKCIEKFA